MKKNPQFQEKKISARKRARSHVIMEKSSKNLISLFGVKPARGLPKPPPTPPHRESSEFTRGKSSVAGTGREIQMRNWDAENGGGGGNAKLNNSSTVQHFDGGFKMKIANTFLLLIALTKSAYLLLASLASKNSEGRVYKMEPELAASPQSTTLHSTGNTSVKKGVSRTKSATAPRVE
jgi:hypothetical protein